MDEDSARAKKARRSAPVTGLHQWQKICTGDQCYGRGVSEAVSKWPYAVGDVPCSKFCAHSIDFLRVDSIKDHLKSKKHQLTKDAKQASSSSGSRSGTQQYHTQVSGPERSLSLTTSRCAHLQIFQRRELRRWGPLCWNIPSRLIPCHRPVLYVQCTYIPRIFVVHFRATKDLL